MNHSGQAAQKIKLLQTGPTFQPLHPMQQRGPVALEGYKGQIIFKP